MSGKSGRSGRPPKPIELKRKLGTDRPDRTPPQSETYELVPIEGAPLPITLRATGRSMWDELTSQKWIARIDLILVQSYCELADHSAEMQYLIEQEGFEQVEPIVTPTGVVVGERKVPHPLLKELRALQKQQLDLATSLGFSPVARARLGVAEIKARSKLEELRQRYNSAQDSNRMAPSLDNTPSG